MLNEFAGIRKVSDESLGQDETPSHTSLEIEILRKYLTIFIEYLRDKKKKERRGLRKREVKIHPFHLPWIRAR